MYFYIIFHFATKEDLNLSGTCPSLRMQVLPDTARHLPDTVDRRYSCT
jgi:hypothetical protein